MRAFILMLDPLGSKQSLSYTWGGFGRNMENGGQASESLVRAFEKSALPIVVLSVLFTATMAQVLLEFCLLYTSPSPRD